MTKPRTAAEHDADIGHPHELIGAVNDIVSEMPFERDGKRDARMDRISALLRIAEQISGRLEHEITYGLPSEAVSS